MSEQQKVEAAREARDVIASRTAGSGTAARGDALRRYLGAAEYHDLKAADEADEHSTEDGGHTPA